MGEIVRKNLLMELTSVGAFDGRGWMSNFAFKSQFAAGGSVGNLVQVRPLFGDSGAFGVLSTSSVLVAVPGVVSFGGRVIDVPFTGSGPASGTALNVTWISPVPTISTGTAFLGGTTVIQDVWTRV